MSVDWNYFNIFEKVLDKYLPTSGQGKTMASQIVTAVNKLVYKWYNDGDVFDNTYYLEGWANDLSSYANWLSKYAKGASNILRKIRECEKEDDYEYLLKELADLTLDESYLNNYIDKESVGDIYNCSGEYRFIFISDDDYEEEEEEDYYYDPYEDDEEE